MHIKRLPIQKENLRALCLVNLWAGSGKRLFMKCFLEDHGYNILTKSLFSSSGQPPRDRTIFPFLKINKAAFMALVLPVVLSPAVLSQERWLRL